MNNIQCISDSYLCSNCGACFVVCPKDAIEFKRTSMGRLYASVKDECIKCGLCKKVCPSIDSIGIRNKFLDKYYGIIENTYVGRGTDKFIFENAQSGGGVTSVVKFLFEKRRIDAAILCKMSIGNPPSVEGIIVTSIEQLRQCQKSCYTPVPLLCALKGIEERESVAVVGLPCHIEGVSLIQSQFPKYNNIKYKFGLVCDRTLSDAIQKVVLSYAEENPYLIHWRDKSGVNGESTYKEAPIILEDSEHNKSVLPKYYRTRLKEFFTAPRCRICSDKLNIHADIVFGDPWGIEGVDWEKGDSLFLTRSKMGEQLLLDVVEAGYLSIREIPVRPVLRGQHIYQRRYLVASSSQALSKHVKCEESYLLSEKQSLNISSKDVSDANMLIESYISREQLANREIIEEAREILNKVSFKSKQSMFTRLKKRFSVHKNKRGYTVLLSGVETENKGAELMLYAIIQELERRHPEANVYIEKQCVKQGLRYIKSPINIQFIVTTGVMNLFSKAHILGILNRFGLYWSKLDTISAIGNVDLYLDGSGLLFSDQRKRSKQTNSILGHRLKHLHKSGSRIVYLPQAFGPIQMQETKEAVRLLDKYADLVFAREKVSFDYLSPHIKNRNKFHISTDFTSLVSGIMPKQYEYLRDAVCVIPNERMISKGVVSKGAYLNLLSNIVEACLAQGKKVYMLNHEGKKDEELAYDCKKNISSDISVVSGLNALEVKGLIASSYLVISSRFHGLASSLNSCVPCLATSWNHKYEELYKDFGVDSCVLPLDDNERAIKMVQEMLDPTMNTKTREKLDYARLSINSQVKKMWEQIWDLEHHYTH